MRIFDIQRFSVYDGPGIRTALFLKGCSLRCAWCHNPEGLTAERQMQFLKDKCIGCGTCRSVCRAQGGALPCLAARERMPAVCDGCTRCAEACPAQALKIFGEEISPQEAAEKLLRDAVFYASSGGGVTFSGGEPLLQAEQVFETCARLRAEGVHCAVETAGNVSEAGMQGAIRAMDLIIFDLKAMDPAVHRRCTGSGNEKILRNLRAVSAAGKPLWVRLPLIPGWNDSAEETAAKANFIASLPHIDRVEVMPYHAVGVSKYESLGMRYEAGGAVPPSAEALEAARAILRSALPDVPVF